MMEVLKQYGTISLDEMKSVRLMNRTDTKYVTTIPVLERILELAQEEYRVQEIDHMYMMPYYTLYLDTHQRQMYQDHLHGKKTRQKIRVRMYEVSGISFLEIKDKSNKGRTVKNRIPYHWLDEDHLPDFIDTHSNYVHSELERQIENRFSRITLVNRAMTERLTIDTGLKFHNFHTDKVCALDNHVIIELKRDGRVHSPMADILKELRVHPSKFSKYCMGMVLTDTSLKHNRFKPRIRMLEKIGNINNHCSFEH